MENSHPPLRSYPNWLELPRDVTLSILGKLTNIEILESAQFVSKMWYDLCKEPSLWRTIHIEYEYLCAPDLSNREDMYLNAVDRSDGGLIDLGIVDIGSDSLIAYAASRSSQLKRLRLARCHAIIVKALKEALVKLNSLEELEVTLCSFQDRKQAISVIKSCSSLTTLKFNKECSRRPWYASDVDALAIAECLPELRHLQLIGNGITNVGLKAILDGCPRLQSLDLCACFHLDVVENLQKRLSKHIKDFRGPNDSTDDYHNSTVYYSDDDIPYVDTYLDF